MEDGELEEPGVSVSCSKAISNKSDHEEEEDGDALLKKRPVCTMPHRPVATLHDIYLQDSKSASKLLHDASMNVPEKSLFIETLLPSISPLATCPSPCSVSSSNSYLKAASQFCQICYHERAFYTCPRCHMRTCSSICVQKHKNLMACSGMQKASVFIPSAHMNDRMLFEDLRFLEDVERVVDAAARDAVLKKFNASKRKIRRKTLNNHLKQPS
jgi:HIT zinc finger